MVEKNVRYPAAMGLATFNSKRFSDFEIISTRSFAGRDVSGTLRDDTLFHQRSTSGHHHLGQASENGPVYFAFLSETSTSLSTSFDRRETPRRARRMPWSINGPGCLISSWRINRA